MPDTEQDEKNRAIMKSLLESFAAIARRLTPDVEPATIYEPLLRASSDASSADEK